MNGTLVSAALAALLALGACNSTPSAMPSHASKEIARMQFVLLMYERNDAWNRLPASERERLLGEYGAWIGDLQKRGIFKDGTPIGRGGVALTGDSGRGIGTTPLDPNAESLTGIFVIEVANADEAARIAATCPALLHGEVVHVRPRGHD